MYLPFLSFFVDYCAVATRKQPITWEDSQGQDADCGLGVMIRASHLFQGCSEDTWEGKPGGTAGVGKMLEEKRWSREQRIYNLFEVRVIGGWGCLHGSRVTRQILRTGPM